MMRRPIALSLWLALAAAAPALGQATLPSDPEATVVADLVVVARANGPAWWKVTKGDSVAWVLGLPSAPTPRTLKWDQAALNRRLKGAKALIAPTTDWSGFPDGPQSLPLLAPAVARRVEAARALLEEPFVRGEYPSVASVVLLRTAYYRYNKLSHDVTPQVLAAARRARVPVTAPPLNKYYWTPQDIDPKEPRMATCINGILDDVVVDPRRYAEAAEAWAIGDVPTAVRVSPRGAGWVCQHLFPGQWERAVAFHTEAIAEALKTPGKSVAALHIPQLVAEDGILARLRARGYTISEPSRPLEE